VSLSPPVPSSLGRALTQVHLGEGLRSELTERLGLTRTAVGSLLRDLDALDLVRTSADGLSPGGAGRPSHTVAIAPEAPRALAVQVRVHTVVVAEIVLGAQVVDLEEATLPSPGTAEQVLGSAAVRVADRLESGHRYVGVGVAVPSAVGRDGTALRAHQLGWAQPVPVRDAMSGLLAARGHEAVPVVVGNDANLGAVAESRHGSGRGAQHLLYLMTGQRGVGGGFVVAGRPFGGSLGYAMEVGHLPVRAEGRRCHCGNTGCLEAEADPVALLAAAGQRDSRDPLAAARRLVAASGADPRLSRAVDSVVERLATALGSLVNTLNPDRIVLAELYADLLRVAPDRLRDLIAHASFVDAASRVETVPASLEQAGLVGAGELAFQPLLDDPRAVLAAQS